jgi:hypothetical protein
MASKSFLAQELRADSEGAMIGTKQEGELINAIRLL